MGKQLHVISSGKQSIDQLVTIIEKIHPYVDYIHLRERKWSVNNYLTTVERLHQKNVPLEKIIINDRVDVAHITNLAGVQLPHHSFSVTAIRNHFPQLKIGRSVQTLQDAQKAVAEGANWLLHGHIFPTSSKPNLQPRGLSSLKRIAKEVDIPVIAIGGITPERTQEVIEAGAQGIAVLSGILLAKDPLQAAIQYKEALES